jgi:cardiolipin synthase
MTIPNYISFSRLLLAPFVVWFIAHELYAFAFWVFLAASISDAIDGYLARRFSIKSKLGSLLDPLADKVLLVTVIITLGVLNHIVMWLVVLVVARDFFLLLAYLTIRKNLKDMKPSMVSKFNTTFQMSYVTLELVNLAFAVKVPELLHQILIYAVAFTTVLSWIGYGKIWLNLMLKK